jgi:hypothetical protein
VTRPAAIVLLLSGLLLAGLAPGSLLAQETPLPFAMPVPEGWRTETIPFPLEFAPDLPYTGLEELRFAPGMFDETSEELWSYAFVWWVGPTEPADAASLSKHLEEYFRGLAHAVGEARDVEVGDASFEAALADNGQGGFRGRAETFDAFVTKGQMRLNVDGRVVDCTAQDQRAVLFALSPQPADHPIWHALHSILEGFRCFAAAPPSAP